MTFLRSLIVHGKKGGRISTLLRREELGASWLGVRGFASGDEKVRNWNDGLING